MFAALPLLMRLAAWASVAALLALAVAIDLAPLAGPQRLWPMPDLLFAVVARLSLCRPAWLPVPMVFAAGLTRDLLAGGAVGPGALVLTLLADRMARSGAGLRRQGLLTEWLVAATGAAVAIMVPAALVWVVLADAPASGALLARWLATVLAYPAMMLLLPVGRGRAAPAAADRGV